MKQKVLFQHHNHKYQNMTEYPEVIALDKSPTMREGNKLSSFRNDIKSFNKICSSKAFF
ncbi:hypothetical protein ACG94X_06555 [Acinetobacter sp. ULE_I010]|uniref:hypothetical protein n=1 Tax=Acinetobacter sp. ULE_I010 TaxID=3373065 RepID=UPI003AF85F41